MSVRRWLMASLAALAAGAAGFWLLTPPRGPHYAVHTLSADAHSLALAQQAGFDTVVQLFSWREIEPTQGQYHWQYPDEVVRGAEYYGLNLVVRLDQHPQWASPITTTLNAPPDDPAAYARFVSAVATRYRGRVKAYIIWNEPNLAQEWGGRRPDPAGYVALLHAAYQAVKMADPSALVVSAGLASTNSQDATALDDRVFLEAMYQAGAQSDFDVLGAHPYGFAYPPDDPHGAHAGLNAARLEDLRAIMVQHDDGGKPVWATELGWTVAAQGQDAWQVVSPQQQADYLVGMLRRAQRDWPWLQLITIWNLDGALRSPQWSGYSLLDAAGQPRLAYTALQAELRTLNRGPQAPRPGEVLPTLRDFWEERWGRPRYPVLAPDTVIHLGDGEFSQPWMPLFGAHNPSTVWEGVVYVPRPGPATWRLTLEIMQSNALGNYVWVNGRRLAPALPPEDYSGSWVSDTWDVPAGWLQPGPNRITVTISRGIPVQQSPGSAWDDLQIKDMVLWR